MCDPLASKTLNNKIVFVYFSLGNLEVKSRSALKHIHLVAMFYNHQVQSYGLNVLLEPILNELKLLEAGIEFYLKGENKLVFGTLSAFPADNLASHAVGGFKLGFANGFRKCRYCLVSDDEMQDNLSDCKLKYRTAIEHDLQCSGLETDLSEFIGKQYGLNYRSCLNDLQFFHVIGGMVPDVMHDILEGCLPLTICEMLSHYVLVEKVISIDQVNHGLRNFQYGPGEVKDRPSIIDINHLKNRKLRQSAAQIWLIAVTIPLILGTLIDIKEKKWICYTMLLEICRLVFKPSISELEVDYLQFLIHEYLFCFKQCYPLRSLTPKMHFLLHYPYLIRLLGPLLAFWCMRYEAKHSFFKRLSHSIGNFINLPFTLSKRHQQWQCKNLFESGPTFLKPEIQISQKIVCTPVCNFNKRFYSQLIESLKISNLAVLRHVPWIKIGSNQYRAKQSLVLCPLKGSSSVVGAFGKIMFVFVDHLCNIFFLCQVFRTLKFDEHVQAFELATNRSFYLVVPYSELLDYRVFHTHSPVDMLSNVPINVRSLYVISKIEIQDLVMRVQQ